MNTKKLLNTALNGLDYVGYQLDQVGITSRVNRHNLAAFLMAEQYRLEGEWESFQARLDRRKAQLDDLKEAFEARLAPLRKPRTPAS
ncbi:MAG: hypothetical protein KGY54_07205 [Oleiphilaceae bacterium]|nr:hypothetical protein [Oleiphilaceae bacterium]